MTIGFNKTILVRIVNATLLATAVLVTAGCGKTYDHDEFLKLVMDKSEEEVRSSLGEPDWIDDFEPKMWTYRSITYSAANQDEKDARALIIFARTATYDSMKVAEVRFE